ncbi:hypothetical protein D9M68_250270 [compost metagenome]
MHSTQLLRQKNMRALGGKKKLRGTSRRLRSLRSWSQSLAGFFPSQSDLDDGYWNIKIPVISTLLDGKDSSSAIRSECAQCLIDAAYSIYTCKSRSQNYCRVTCVITQPYMFNSEICVFASEQYFGEHTVPGTGRFGRIANIAGRSICAEWGLEIPAGFEELGVIREEADEEGVVFYSEYWYIGEVFGRGP